MRNLVALSATVAQKVLKKVLKKNKNGSTSVCRSILVSGWLDSDQRPHAPQTRTELLGWDI